MEDHWKARPEKQAKTFLPFKLPTLPAHYGPSHQAGVRFSLQDWLLLQEFTGGAKAVSGRTPEHALFHAISQAVHTCTRGICIPPVRTKVLSSF